MTEDARDAKHHDSAFDLRNPYNIRELSNHALGTASDLCEKETVIPIQHSVYGAGVVSSKVENTFHKVLTTEQAEMVTD